MARKLRVEVDGDSRGGQKALDDFADELVKASKRTDQLGDDMVKTTREASRLENQIKDTKRSIKELNAAYNEGGDPKVLQQLAAQQRELAKIERIQKNLTKEEDARAKIVEKAAKAAQREHAQFLKRQDAQRKSGGGNGFSGLTGLIGGANPADALGKVVGADPVTLAVLAGGAGLLAPFALAAAGGATAGAGAAGAVGAGVAGAVAGDPERFKTEWSDAITVVSNRWKATAGDSFGEPVLDAIDRIEEALGTIDFDRIFGKSATFLGPLTEGIAQFSEYAIDGFEDLVDAAGPVVAVLGKELPYLGAALGDALSAIASESSGGAQALGDLIHVTANFVLMLGQVVGGAEAVYLKIVQLRAGLVNLVSDDPARGMLSLGGAVESTEHNFYGLAGAVENNQKVLDDLNDAISRFQNQASDALQGTLDFEAAVDNVTESVKENGTSLDINTEKGRANIQTFKDGIDILLANRDAAIAAGNGSAAATAKANAEFERGKERLLATASAAGLAKAQLQQLANQLSAMPPSKTVTLNVKTVYWSEGSRPAGQSDQRTGNSRMAGYAEGGTVKSTGWAMVGEKGPEIRWLNQGDQISTAAQTRQIMGGSSGGSSPSAGASTTVIFAGDTTSAFASAFMKMVDNGQIQIKTKALV